MPSVYTQSGPTLEAELGADHQLIDRKLVRLSLRWRPDWTGVTYKVNVRLTYTIRGQLFAFEEPVGHLGISAPTKEREAMQRRVDALVDRIKELCAKLELAVRGASHD